MSDLARPAADAAPAHRGPQIRTLAEVRRSYVAKTAVAAAAGVAVAGSLAPATAAVDPGSGGGDLVARIPKFPKRAYAGARIKIDVKVTNRDPSGGGDGGSSGGGDVAPRTDLQLFLSENDQYDAADVPVGKARVPKLGIGKTKPVKVWVTIPDDAKAGPWHVLAKVDASDEIDEYDEYDEFGEVVVDGEDNNIAVSTSFELTDDLRLHQHIPSRAEVAAVGAFTAKIRRNTPEFNALATNTNEKVVFKNEEGDPGQRPGGRVGDDQRMTSELEARTDALAELVAAEWPGVLLRVTEAWDGQGEHEPQSMHYEARAVDITTSDKDAEKLGRLGRLAVEAGFAWVWYENRAHVHASVN